MNIIGEIVVIDAPCGSGKTSWAIQYIKEHTEDSFVYCTPFLDEIERIRRACGKSRFRVPNNYESTKIENFNELLAVGTDIAVTHSTFINATAETKELIEQGEYTMLLDEALEVVVDFNKITSVERAPEQRVSAGDIRMMKDQGLIQIGDNCLVEWIGGEYKDSKLSEVERLAKLHRLYCARGRLLVCIFPPDIFQKFKQVYVMTYMIGGTDLQRYFELFGIDYTLSSVIKNGTSYELIPYSCEIDYAARRKYKELVTICDSPRLNQGYKRTSLTKTWYDKADSDALRRLSKDLTYFFAREAGARAGNYDIMWTCPTDHRKKVQGKGFTCVRQLRKEELNLPDSERKAKEKELACFVPLNAKATNAYADRWALAYCSDMRLHPMIKGFFQDCGVEIDEDLFSLSCLIQWLFRSRIRKGERIIIYLPSPRMRELLQRWLNCEI